MVAIHGEGAGAGGHGVQRVDMASTATGHTALPGTAARHCTLLREVWDAAGESGRPPGRALGDSTGAGPVDLVI